MPARWSVTLVLALVALVSTGCSPQTLGAPGDGYELTATFDTVDNLVVGHAVRLADVQVGTVTDVELDGHRARVTLALQESVRLPGGTVAAVRRTSLLGEDYVALQAPDDGDGIALTDGDELPSGPVQAGLEEVAHQALQLVHAVAAEDAVALVDALDEMVGGREEQLASLLEEVADTTGHYAAHREELADAIDGMADLGAELAETSPHLESLVDDLDESAAVLARQRERMVGALEGLPRLGAAARAGPLGETRAELEEVIGELGPVAADIAGDEERFNELVDNVVQFAVLLQEAVDADEEELDLYGLLLVDLLEGDLPDSSGQPDAGVEVEPEEEP